MARLSLSLLGAFEVRLDGRPVAAFAYDKVRALLAYLVVESEHARRREALAGLLWPDWPERSARQSLSQALYNLREAIGDREAGPPYLLTSRETVQFSRDSDYELDVEQFESLVVGEDPGGWEEAISLYRGPFLEGFSLADSPAFEQWMRLERERLQRQVTETLGQLVAHCQDRGEPLSALGIAERWVELVPWDEEGHRFVIRLLALAGRRSAALAQYEVCRRTLAEELDVEPSAVTTDLYERIRDEEMGTAADLQGREEERVPPAPGAPPFKGLHFFDVADADLFYGREALVFRLVERLREGERFLAVVGASGSGKSSLVRAGLVSALQRGDPLADGTRPLKGSARWPVHLITPTAHPLEALAVSLTRDEESVTAATNLIDDMARDARSLRLYMRRSLEHLHNVAERLLLVVDQFEETFTLCRDASERQAFLDNLLYAASEGSAPAVVIALRADFYHHCAQHEGLREALERHQAYIGAMTTEELRRAIEAPAEGGGWTFEAGLVELLLRDVGAHEGHLPEPGALPLLSHALLETWRRRRGRELTLAGYAEAGEVRGAIAHTAEAVYQGLDGEQQGIARNVFLRLTELGEGTQDTRRRATLDELVPGAERRAAVEAVLNILADARLVTTERDAVEVAHEALIREWPTLREWLEEDREGLRVHRHLSESASEWARLERDPGELYRGARLAGALEWAREHEAVLNSGERAFLDASEELRTQQEAAREAQRQRELEAAQQLAQAETQRAEEQARSASKLRHRAVWLALALVIALVAAITAGALGNQARLQSADNATLAAENVVVAAAAQAGEATAEAASTRAGVEREAAQTAQMQEALQRATAQAANTQAVEQKEQAELQARVNLANSLAVQSQVHLQRNSELALLLALEAQDLFDTWSHRGALLTALEHHPYRVRFLTGHTDFIFSLSLSPDGRVLAVAALGAPVYLYDVKSGAPIGELDTDGIDSVVTVAFSPDGKTLIAGGCAVSAEVIDECPQGALVVWNWETGERMASLGTAGVGAISSVAFSPDGAWLATGGCGGLVDGLGCGQGEVILWNTANWEPVGPPLAAHATLVGRVAFGPDGKTLATAGCKERDPDGWCNSWEAVLWSASALLHTGMETPSVLHSFVRQGGTMSTLAFAPDGTILATGGCEELIPGAECNQGEIVLWDVEAGQPIGQPLLGHPGGLVSDVAFSPDGTVLASAGSEATLVLWDVETHRPIGRPLIGHTNPVQSLAFSPDGRTLATGSADRTVGLWDLMSFGGISPVLARAPHFVAHMALSSDGMALAASGCAHPSSGISCSEGTAHAWKLIQDAEGDLVALRIGEPLIGLPGMVWSVALHPDGHTVALGASDGTIHLWDIHTGIPIREPLVAHAPWAYVLGLAFTPDGTVLVSGGFDAAIRLWDVATWTPIGEPLTGHTSSVTRLAISPDGKMLASASGDHTVRLWDVETGQPIGEPLTGHTNIVMPVVFSPDGTLLASSGQDRTIRLWDVQTGQQVGPPLVGQAAGTEGMVWALAFSPGGQVLAAGSSDRMIRLWEVATGKPIGAPLLNNAGPGGLAFAPDGRILIAGDGVGIIRQWDMDPASWQERACRAVGRNMTQAEWAEYMPGVPYHKTCAQWPAGE